MSPAMFLRQCVAAPTCAAVVGMSQVAAEPEGLRSYNAPMGEISISISK